MRSDRGGAPRNGGVSPQNSAEPAEPLRFMRAVALQSVPVQPARQQEVPGPGGGAVAASAVLRPVSSVGLPVGAAEGIPAVPAGPAETAGAEARSAVVRSSVAGQLAEGAGAASVSSARPEGESVTRHGNGRPMIAAAAVVGSLLLGVPLAVNRASDQEKVNYEGMSGAIATADAIPIASGVPHHHPVAVSQTHIMGAAGDPVVREKGASGGPTPEVGLSPAPAPVPSTASGLVEPTSAPAGASPTPQTPFTGPTPGPDDPSSRTLAGAPARVVAGHDAGRGSTTHHGAHHGAVPAANAPAGALRSDSLLPRVKSSPVTPQTDAVPAVAVKHASHLTPTTAKVPAKRATAKPAAKPATKRATAKPAAKPATKPAAKPAAKPATKPAAKPAAKPSVDWSTKVVQGTAVLLPGQSFASNRMRVTMSDDGNLVITDEHGRARWSSGTAGRGSYAVFQADGNLVVYTTDRQTAWSSRTDGHDGAELVIQDDGNVVISQGGQLLWSAGT